jgi:hypothetical protein
MIIAVDFDGTLCDNAWPGIGKPNGRLIALLIAARSRGDKVILWTCREGRLLLEALDWCRVQGLAFDAINRNAQKYKHAKHKVVADVYIDDRGMSAKEYICRNGKISSNWNTRKDTLPKMRGCTGCGGGGGCSSTGNNSTIS